MRPDLPSGTVTFLFTDVEGSTKLLHELGADAYADALAEHRRLIREACTAEGGVEVDTQGDAFFFAFANAPGALAAAADFTDALASGPITVRAGLHTGTPLLTEEGYVGDDVHRAARVAATGHGGQVVLSAATATLVEAELADLGEHRLKDVAEAVTIYQLGSETFPPLKTISNTNLPRPASSFVGRERELADVLATIEGGARLVTLTGPGGTGKTRLALEVAAALVPEYKGGVFWVALAALRDPALVTQTIAQTLGARDGLAEHVAERELLLLLDNLEQVIEAAPELASLLERCPELVLLVTSRELLRVRGEVEYAVLPLAAPEAISLFCERAQLEPSSEIAELCARLDSLPLAVELAAARTKALTPAQILERLAQRLDLLKGGRDADPRQQTLRATIEWSYDLLAPAEQQLFARLSVFAGGCTLEAAEAVTEADLDTLQSLVEKSLLRFTNERYWMLETIREYAEGQLAEMGEAARVLRRHARHMVVRYAGMPREGSTWVRLLEAERDNMRAALRWSFGEDAVDEALALATAYGALCVAQGPLTEGTAWLDAALQIERAEPVSRWKALAQAALLSGMRGDYEDAERLAEAALLLARNTADPTLIGKSLNALGVIACNKGDWDRGELLLEEAHAVFAEGQEDREVRHNLNLLAFPKIQRKDYSSAQAVIEQALALARAADDQREVLRSVANLSFVLARQGQFENALGPLREALILAEQLEGTVLLALLFEDVAGVAAGLGRCDVAATVLGAAGELIERTGRRLEPVQREWHEETMRRISSALDEESLVELWEKGRMMAREELLDYSVEFIDSSA